MPLQDKTRWEPAEVEPRLTRAWLAAGLNHPDPDASGPAYSIAIPPPNVTGALHMGHALNGSVQDTLIRWHRMGGARAKWILGTDHAGIATQTQVEKLLKSEGTSRDAVGREEFTRRTWEWRARYGGTIVEQLKRLGASCDYEEERFTLDPGYVEAVLQVFTTLYDRGLIYRDNYMVNWDPGSRSAISNLEVEEREVEDEMYEVAYPLADGSGEVVVATVRPETMLGDVAVAVHPDDERHASLVGKSVVLPLVGRKLPVIADEYVQTNFGTGCLKITPGHDPNDFEIGRRHGLPELAVIGEDGRMTAQAGPDYAGLPVLEARERVVAALGDAVRSRRPHVHSVPFSHRSGERIEPLVSLQWFMREAALAQPAIDAVQSGDLRIHPESQQRRYLHWLENIRPWCISRQLWWGHRIPVWYRGEETYVGIRPPEGDGWTQDPDVLDTWFSSALWPFATLGWPQDTAQLRAFYPTDVLSTGRDILFLWVARMVMLGVEFTGRLPFADVYNHSVIQAPDGRRMTKSLGTGIDPLTLIDGGPRPPVFAEGGDFPAYGADAVRFGLLAMSSTQDVRFSEEKVAQGRALANKLFNASRFVLGKVPADTVGAPRPTTVEDRWILSRLQAFKAELAELVAAFNFSRAALGLYDFVYGELCDWYVELTKARGVDADLAATLVHVLRETLAVAHPVIPFVTEELWANLPGADGKLLAAARRPEIDEALRDPEAEATVAAVIAAISTLRAWRQDAGVQAGAPLPVRVNGIAPESAALVMRMARLEAGGPGPAEATITIPGGTVEVLAGAGFDPAQAARKLEQRRARLGQEIARAEGKLADERFVAKAPEAVVAAEREKLARLREELDAL